jgi:hypothetical protein
MRINRDDGARDEHDRGHDSVTEVTTIASLLNAPGFEATRARMLRTSPGRGSCPMQIRMNANVSRSGQSDHRRARGTIFLDDDIRPLHRGSGIARAAPCTRVVGAPVEVRWLRERKSRDGL